MSITENNIKLEGQGFLPHDTKYYRAYFVKDINFIFSKDKLMFMGKSITINGALTDYQNSFCFFTDEGIPASHVTQAKKDLEGWISNPDNKDFEENVEKILRKEKLWKEA
jgi:hypothetical protein|tara:strand:- start:745 stop:1074 length:330 start_codon:yes stop_codon:yes gene_type:complete